MLTPLATHTVRALSRPAKLVVSACLLLVISACDSGGDNRRTVEAEAGEGGQLSPSTQRVERDTEAQLRLSIEPGYELAGLSGCGGTLNNRTYTTEPVTEDCTVTARFELEEYRVRTRTDGDGTITPSFETLTIEDTASFTLAPDEDFRLASVSGCGGTLEGNTYTLENVQSDCTIQVDFEPDVYRVSGEISAAALTSFDHTLNDSTLSDVFGAPEPEPNGDFQTGQPINNRTTLSGFASAVPTGDYCVTQLFERFRESPNPDDFYRVNLQAGQLIQLQVVNHDGHNGLCASTDQPRPAGDLDLYLFAFDGASELDSAIGTGEFEEIIVPETGDYILNVRAEAGISKYVLRLLPEGTPPLTNVAQNITGDFVPGEMLVKNRSASSRNPSQNTTQTTGRDDHRIHRETLAPLQGQARRGPPARALEVLRQRNPAAFEKLQTIHAIKARRQDPSVEYAEPNYRRYVQREPNDPRFFRQWHYGQINLPRAWDLSVGNTPNESDTPIVAVLDTGVVLEHPDLQNQLIPGSGYDFIDNDSDPSDPGDSDGINPDSWHGTHVAGTIAADSDNGIGGAGVSWGARLMPVRVLGEGGGTSLDVIEGVRYAAGLSNRSNTQPQRRADIINMSLGGTGFSRFEADLYARVRDEQGVILVASSGNDNSTTPLYPASYPGVLSVGATNARGERAPYSNFGETLDLVAPGGSLREDANGDGVADGIFSTVAQRDGEIIEPGYSFAYQGTSMAAPHVSGVLALMKAVHPALTPDQVDMMLAAGELTGTSERTSELGLGQIDAELSVGAAYRLANEDEEVIWPPRVVVTPSRLNMGNTAQALIELTNEGGSDPQNITSTTDAAWLSLEPVTVDSSGIGSYQVNIEREGLSDGFYQGDVTFLVDGETSLTLRVYMQVGELSTEGELTILYVLLIDPDTDEVVDQALALPDEDGRTAQYVFDAVYPGQYLLTAGSDVDADGFICQSGEQCGSYPSQDRDQPIEVGERDRDNLDFVASIIGGFTESNALKEDSTPDESAPQGYPIRPPKAPETDNTRQVPQDLP
ncbi:S8 family peptidase [Marinimicrobium sp. C2-29]|uniref:S8 family peptidase n=1 Tax=Marinimicrobium sp. C2-29 TaxID=3139825 RepID=UPI0031395CA0